MRYFVFCLLVALVFGSNVVAQEVDTCVAWRDVLSAYGELDDTDVLTAIGELRDLRYQVESVDALPETSEARIVLLNLLHLRTSSLIATTSSNSDVSLLVSSWDGELQAAHVEAAQQVGRVCLAASDEPQDLVIADFNNCNTPNSLGGGMGAAFSPPNNKLTESYGPDDPEHGCVARLEYEITEWAAFWLNLNNADFSPYSSVAFDIKADTPVPQQVKIELKRDGAAEWATVYVAGITDQWQRMQVDFDDFNAVSWAEDLSTLTD